MKKLLLNVGRTVKIKTGELLGKYRKDFKAVIDELFSRDRGWNFKFSPRESNQAGQ